MFMVNETPEVDAVFAALANPTRRAILARLARDREVMATELAAPFDLTQPAVSHHIGVLESAGLIARRVDGTRRPCRLSPEGVATVDRWLDTLREGLEASYDRLDALLAGSESPGEEENA